MCVCTCVCSAHGCQKRASFSGPEIISVYKLSHVCWKGNRGPLQEQQVLFKAEPSLQPQTLTFLYMAECLLTSFLCKLWLRFVD